MEQNHPVFDSGIPTMGRASFMFVNNAIDSFDVIICKNIFGFKNLSSPYITT